MWWEKRRPRPILVSALPMNAGEFRAAFRGVDTSLLWRAVHQILEEELREVRTMATVSVKDHGILASWVGAAEVLERMRTRLLAERENAMESGVKENG